MEAKGRLRFLDKDNNIIHETSNMVVYSGGNILANLMKSGDKKYCLKQFMMGIDNTEPDKRQTALVDPLSPTLSCIDITSIDIEVVPDQPETTKMTCTINIPADKFNRDNPAGGVSYKEAGLFDGNDTPTMFSRTTGFTAVKADVSVFKIIWEITFAESTRKEVV